eukprot:CAMPEP_0172739854 /NCGR_PEP_ID=MMETSP1074-20121228/123436_1 /TAXON_ID=2916 /ORGANISM="Ceratium fusus, Strain PA161109" /LENGTH=181 /DNA_ID=CAMNT_0013569823 /DNA_START=168 /DNA_END=714 /DNA_ORIENTATION=+
MNSQMSSLPGTSPSPRRGEQPASSPLPRLDRKADCRRRRKEQNAASLSFSKAFPTRSSEQRLIEAEATAGQPQTSTSPRRQGSQGSALIPGLADYDHLDKNAAVAGAAPHKIHEQLAGLPEAMPIASESQSARTSEPALFHAPQPVTVLPEIEAAPGCWLNTPFVVSDGANKGPNLLVSAV